MRWSLRKRPVGSHGNTKPGTRRHRLGRWRAPLALEILEDRTLLSTVHWSAAGSGDWNTAANWDAGRVPGSADDVVLNAPGNVTVTHSGGDHTVHSLQGGDGLVISGGSITVTSGTNQLTGTLTVNRATLSIAGAGTSFTATGMTTLTGASLYATGGATLALPAATSYAGTDFDTVLQASDANSKLDLSHLTRLTGGGYYSGLQVRAYGGGKVDFSAVTTDPGGRINILTDGANSLVDLSLLPKMLSDVNYNSSLEARNQSTIKVPLLTMLDRVDIAVNAGATMATRQITAFTGATITDNGATPDFTGLTKIDGLSLVVNGGGTLAFPAATSYAGVGNDTVLQASDANSKLDLSHLTKLTGGGYYSGLQVHAYGGGKVDLSAVTNDTGGRINILADGMNSTVDLSLLPKMISDVYYNSSMEARNGATIKVSLLTTLNRVDVAVGATGTLATRQFTTYTGATVTVNGAAVDLSGLTSIAGDAVALNGGSVNLQNVTNIDGASLTVSGGATLAVPGATSYAGAGNDTTLQASDANSKLDLSHLTKLTGGGYYSGLQVHAYGGGKVDFSAVTADPGGRINILADGMNSLVDLSLLPRMVSDVYYNSSMEARNGATIKVPLLTTLNRVDVAVGATGTLATHQFATYTGATVTVNGAAVDLSGLTSLAGDAVALNGGSVNLQNVTNIDGSSLTVSGGATLAVPGATSYTGVNNDTTLQASDANSKLDLSHLTKLTGGDPYGGVQVRAYGGGLVNLSGVTNNPGGRVNVLADGTNSTVDLSLLPKMVSDNYYNSSLEARNGATIRVPLLATLNRVDVTLNTNATLATHQITTYTGATITVNGAAVDLSGLTSIAGDAVALNGGSVNLQNVTNIDGSSLTVSGGATLAVPGATSYTGVNNDTTLQASGANSKLDLSHLTKLTGGDPYGGVQIRAYSGGLVNLSTVTNNPAGRLNILADGTNSTVDLSQLAKMVSDNYYNSSLEARNSATIKVPLLATLNRVDLTINANVTLATHQIAAFTGATITDNGATPDFTSLTSIDGLSLVVNGGGNLAFPAVTSYTGVNNDTVLQASDANSKLDLSHLTKLTGGDPYGGVQIHAYGGGKVDLSGVTSNPSGRVNVLADGTNSLVDLSLLPKMVSDNYYNSSLEARNGATIKVPLLATLNRVDVVINTNATLATHQITTFTGATITDNGATPDFTGLTSIDGLSLVVNGGTLAFPAATSYTGVNNDTTLQASGANSKLDLSHLTMLKGGDPYGGVQIRALGGGLVNLSGVTSNPGGRLNVLADGASSTVDLSQLPRMVSDNYYNSSLEVRNNGTIKDPLLANLSRVDVTLDGSNTSIGNAWTTYTSGTLTINGGSYTLPKLADFVGSNLNARGGTLTFSSGTVTTIANLSTGLDSSGKRLTRSGQADASWTVQEANGTTGAAQAVFPDSPDFGSWPADGPASDWIARDASTARQGTAPYTFTRTFDLTGYNLATVSLAGGWSIDDTGTLAINGHAIDMEVNGWNNFATFLVSGAGGLLNQGVNTLTMTITASDNNVDGVRLDALLTTSAGLAAVLSSNITVNTGATLNLPTGRIPLTRSSLNPSGGTVTAGTIELFSASTLSGTGTVTATVLNSSGQVHVAGSSGILQITGDYTQTTDGTITTDIGGGGGGQFGRFTVSGTATLDGTLNVNLTNGYYPGNGAAFQVVTAGTLAGQFATINGLTQNGRRTFQPFYRSSGFAVVTVLDDLYPDLQVANLATNPASGLHSASNVTITWSDSNTGKAATPNGANWSDRIVVKNLTTGQTLLNTTIAYDTVHRGPIAVNGSQAQQYAYTLPPGTPGAGMIEIDVTVNTFFDVFEFNDAGNADTNNTTTITRTSTLFVPSAELHVENFNVAFSAGSRVSGSAVTVTWDDANRGNTATSGSFTDTVVVTNATTGRTIAQVSLPYVESANGNGSIAVNDHRTRQVALTLPDGVDSVGNLTFTVTADAYNQLPATDRTHSTASATAGVTLAPYPDLTVMNLRVSQPATLTSGAHVTLGWDDANIGTGAVPISYYDSILVQKVNGDGTFTTVAAGNLFAPSNLMPGGSSHLIFAFDLPQGTAGAGQFRVTVTDDAGNQVKRFDRQGNPATDNTASLNATSVLAAYADLKVTNIGVPDYAYPGQPVTISYTVTNSGMADAAVAWTDAVYVSTSPTGANPVYLQSFRTTTPLAAGASRTVMQNLTMPNTGLDGPYYFVVTVNSGSDVIELDRTNNTAVAAQATLLPQTITLALPVSSVSETGAPFQAAVTRSGNPANPLTLYLNIQDTQGNASTGHLSVPTSVTIPAGQSSAFFTVTPVWDHQVTGTLHLVVEAQTTNGVVMPGTLTATAPVDVLDIDKPAVSLRFMASQLSDGQTTQGTITINPASVLPVTVTLTMNVSQQLSFPTTLTIPAGQIMGSFSIMALDFPDMQVNHTVVVTAGVAGYTDGTAAIQVIHNHLVNLTVSASPGQFVENVLGTAAVGTVTRSVVTARDLVVVLASSLTTAAKVPAQVTIPAGQASAQFPIYAVDDPAHQFKPTRTVSISANATDPFTGDVISRGAGMTSVQVLNAYGPTFTVKSDRATIPQAGMATGTVTRNTGTTGALVVTLASSDVTAATVPATVTIPDGANSVTFPIHAVDTPTNGTKVVTISATATGFSPAALSVQITDIHLPELRVTTITAPATALTGHTFSVSWTVANEGLITAGPAWVDRVFLATQPVLTPDAVQLGQFDINGNLPVGQQYSWTANGLQLPTIPGTYYVIVNTDASNAIVQVDRTENILVAPQPLVVAPSYHATVVSAVRQSVAGQPVTLHGKATLSDTGMPATYSVVTVFIRHAGTSRPFAALTDGNGNYTLNFQPLPGEGGDYQVGADHPGVPDAGVPNQDSFTIIGMKAVPPAVTQSVVAGKTIQGSVQLTNLSNVALTHVQATVQGKPANLNVQVLVASSLAGNAMTTLNYTIQATDASVAQAALTITLTNDQGATLAIPLSVAVVIPTAHLTGPAILKTGMVRGEQATWEFSVTNDGGAPTGPIQVAIPQAPWLTLATPPTMPSLDPGQSANVDLVLSPATTLPLGPYTGTIGLNYGNTGLGLPFSFNNISSAMGDVQVTVVDENTYYGTNKTGLAGASVSLLSPFDGSIAVSGVTDANGNITFLGVREGAYNLQVTAAKHDGYKATFMVSPGQVNTQTVFVRTQLVTYNWQVQSTNVQDQTNVTLVTTFTTQVPVPVVTIDPGVIDLATITGNSGTVNLTVTNHGLIAARNVKLNFPTNANWKFTPLVSDIGDLPANSSLTIPVTIQRLGNGPQGADSGGCNIQAELDWTLICGPFGVVYPVPIFILHVSGGCGGTGGGVPVFGGGGIGGGLFGPVGTYYSPPPSCKCDPNNFHQQGVKGEVGFSVGLFEGWINKAINAALAAAHIPLSIESLEFKASISGEIDTCCEDGVQGLKAKASGSIGIEGKARLGVSLPALPPKSINIPGLGDVEVKADVFGGVEFTLSGEVEGEYETECNFANPKLKISGQIKLEAFAGLIAKAEAEYTDPVTHQTYGGGLEGKVGVTGEGSISISGGTDEGVHGSAELGPVNFTASLSGELKVGNKTFSVETSYTYTIYQGGSGGDGPGAGGDLPDSVFPSLASVLPAPLTVARLMQLNGYASVANMVQGFTGAPLPFPLTDDSSLVDVAHAIEATFETSQATLRGNVHYASHVQGDNQQPPPPTGDNGVCAQVQLEVDQQAVVTRKAISASLDISNASDTDPVQNLYVSITIYDAQGNDATDKFVIQPPKLTNLTVINDGKPPPDWDETHQGPWTGLPSWLLAPGATGTASWIILPTDAAAPDGPVVYMVGGSFTYTQNGVPHSILLLPGPVTVYPNPQLTLNYFLQRDVYAQDPFVNYTQPSVPFALGVLVTNTGKGVAQDFHIISAQPQIVENYKGLQINFQIIGTQVEGKNFSPSLTADFGDIQPGQTVVGEWLFQSSLQGHFINYTAMFENTDGLGGTGASVFNSVAIHEMIHVVKPTQGGGDGLPGFLVNDLPTDNNLPDTIYLDNGTKAPVTQATNGQFDHAPAPGMLQVQVTATMQAGWSYLQMPDPANGKYHLVRIVRSDGLVLPVDDDAWVTDRTFGLDPTARPTYENILHLLDYNSTGRYTFYYAPNDTTPPMIQQLAPITSPRTTAIDEEDVTLSKAIDPTTFTRAALVLTRDGGTNLITTAVTIVYLSDTVYAIRGLAGLTGTDGVYHLIVSAAGLQDGSGNAGTGSLDITWTMAAQAPTVVSLTGTTALRNTPVSSLTVTFSKPIDLTTFDYHVLSLTLNNGANLITSAATVTQTGTSTYQINGLNLLTGAAGQYVFSIQVTAIKDQAGHPGTGSATLGWTVDLTPPTLTANSIATVPSPRNTAVVTIDVTFSKPINLATFTYRALTLTRGGGANLITPAVMITWVSGATYRINDLDALQAMDGTYVLTVDASILQDAAGNAGQGAAMRSWVVDNTIPAAPANLVVVPTGSGVVKNGVSSTLSVTITGTLSAAGLVVHLYDATALTALPDAVVSGTSFSRTLVFTTAGAHRIQVQAANAAGSLSSPSFFDLFIDLTPPSVSQVVAVVPAARRTAVASVDVVFTKPIDPTTLDYHQVTLTLNGGANLITSAVQVTLVSGARFRISGLSGLTGTEGVYVLTVSAVGVKDPVANQGTGSASTQWVNDQAPPQSMVLPLPAQALTQSFLVQWSGTDRPTPGGSGIAFFNIYVAQDGGAFTIWQANTTATSATFTGLTGHHYDFYSVATDNAGNVEPTPTMPQTSTLITTGASGFRIVPSGNPVVAGTAFTITVSAHDANGNLVPGFTGLVHFTSTDPAGTLPGDYTFTAADAGVHTFTVTLKTAGSRSLGVAAGVLTGSATVTVNPAAASRLVLTGFPNALTAGMVGMMTVTAFDPYGNIAAGYTGTLHFTSTDVQAALPANYTFTAADNGAHTFSITLKTAGSWAVAATDTMTGSLTATQSGITVTPAATSRLTVAGFPASVTAGVAGMVTVTALDAYGNVTPAYRGAIHFSSSDIRAVLPGDYTFLAADNGVHTFSGIILKTAATQSLTATDTAAGTITGTQTGIVVNPAATSALTVTGFPSPATAGVASMVTVTAVDAFGNATPAYRGVIHFTSSDAQAVLPGDYTFAAGDNGMHTFSGVILKTAATQRITATDTMTGTITGTQGGIVVNPAAADHFQVTAPAQREAGHAFTLTVTAFDPYGNVAVNYTGTITFHSSDTGALLPADYTYTPADAGVVTFVRGATLFTAGAQTVTVADVATGLLLGSTTVLVTPAAADHFQLDAPASSVAGQAFDLTLTALDPYGNIAVNYKGTATFSSSDGQAALPSTYTFTPQDQGVATFSAGATLFRAGSQTISVSGTQTIQGTTERVTGLVQGGTTVLVTAAAADHFQVTAPTHHLAGSAFTLTLTALDPYGNVAVNYIGTATFSSSDPQALLPPDYTFTAQDQGVATFVHGATLFQAGSQNITATDVDTGLLTGSATVMVNPGPVGAVLVSLTGEQYGAAPGAGATPLRTSADSPGHALGALRKETTGRDGFFAALAGDESQGLSAGSHRPRGLGLGDDWFNDPLM